MVEVVVVMRLFARASAKCFSTVCPSNLGPLLVCEDTGVREYTPNDVAVNTSITEPYTLLTTTPN